MHVFLFDIDGTLIKSGGAGKAAMEAGLTSAFGVNEILETVSYAGRTDNAICKELLEVHGLDASPEHSAKLLEAYLTHLPRTLVELPGRVLEGVAPLLKFLKARENVAVGLLTGNVRRGAELKLTHYGLWHLFDFGGFADGFEVRDDVARHAFESTLKHLNRSIEPNRFWVIGDTPADVICAQSISANSLAVASGWHTLEELSEHMPTLVMQDLTEAIPHFEEYLSSN
jgi:phosphoglycolate phosphatase